MTKPSTWIPEPHEDRGADEAVISVHGVGAGVGSALESSPVLEDSPT